MTTKKSDPGGELAKTETPVTKWTEEHRASVVVDPPGRRVSDETVARIVDLCNHAVRTDAGGTGKLAKQILVDLCLVDVGA
jgi:hypothetical protein